MYTCTCTYPCTFIIKIHICRHVCLHIYTYVCIDLCVSLSLYIYTYILLITHMQAIESIIICTPMSTHERSGRCEKNAHFYNNHAKGQPPAAPDLNVDFKFFKVHRSKNGRFFRTIRTLGCGATLKLGAVGGGSAESLLRHRAGVFFAPTGIELKWFIYLCMCISTCVYSWTMLYVRNHVVGQQVKLCVYTCIRTFL